jgi:hypothetical protein
VAGYKVEGPVVIRSTRKVRDGWATAFQEMAQRGDDMLLDVEAPGQPSWDEDEWQW